MMHSNHDTDKDEPIKSLSELTGWRRYLLLTVAVIVLGSTVFGLAVHVMRLLTASGY
ncbi:hypothetical protein [uncultured Thalassospira sp.]|jgi:hypothetical protein|uniref:hypothetical protein n=1 Tax=uncultured Thalassospira sp. TaxID=404382 RepID=UPI0030D880F6|tara:strand:- start:4906 stop:5076 length:171 start_codon:yes stop_codon:yes gene_type:complete